jgi:hypothetical protein
MLLQRVALIALVLLGTHGNVAISQGRFSSKVYLRTATIDTQEAEHW